METASKEGKVENIALQLQEIEMLEAMFPGENEIVWYDPLLIIDAQQFKTSEGRSPSRIKFLVFELNLKLPLFLEKAGTNLSSTLAIKVSITLPTMYPGVKPELSIISDLMSRGEQTALKMELNSFISTLDTDELILLEIISWIQENTLSFYKNKEDCSLESKDAISVSNEMTHMWLYMHHIYSKTKRKDIQNWAHDYNLTGFSLPGKPGVVYIEGVTTNVEDYFDRLRSLPWKRITCRVKEVCLKRTFDDFQELCFDVHGAHNYHMDLGQFYEYLTRNNLGHMFKELFGVEGQNKDKLV